MQNTYSKNFTPIIATQPPKRRRGKEREKWQYNRPKLDRNIHKLVSVHSMLLFMTIH